MTTVIKKRQTLIDLSAQQCGSVEASFSFSQLNKVSLTAEFNAETALTQPEVVNKKLAEYYTINGVLPATAPVKTKVFGSQFTNEFE